MPRPRPFWLRRLRCACLFVLLGLVTTVGVAWALAVLVESTRALSDSYPHRPIDYIGPGTVHRVWFTGGAVTPGVAVDENPSRFVWAWSPGGRYSWGSFRAAMRRGGSEWGVDEARGWPALALWCRVEDVDEIGQAEPLKVQGAISLPLSTPNVETAAFRALPLLPIWPGLAFNTAFYGLLWWLAFASLRMVKHNRRYRRGLCPACRYDLRADYSGGCSECGWGR